MEHIIQKMHERGIFEKGTHLICTNVIYTFNLEEEATRGLQRKKKKGNKKRKMDINK